MQGDAPVAAAQMSISGTPFSVAQEAETPLVESCLAEGEALAIPGQNDPETHLWVNSTSKIPIVSKPLITLRWTIKL